MPKREARRPAPAYSGGMPAAAAARAMPTDAMPADAAPDPEAAAIAAVCRALEAGDGPPPPLARLAALAGLPPARLRRCFRAATGLTPHAYAQAHRAARARALLAAGRAVTDAAYAAGFGAASRFYAQAADMLGMAPGQYRRGGVGQRIAFALAQCSLGALLVARSARGLCAIALGEDPEALLRELQDRFPRAELVGGDPGFEQWVAQVVALVEAPRRGLALPLDVQGTAFQQRVWRALQAIPPGRTASYAEIARALGQPRAVRAVARACAANPLAVAIPCHRVVRSDGAPSGYRWGLARKQALLAREREDAAAPPA